MGLCAALICALLLPSAAEARRESSDLAQLTRQAQHYMKKKMFDRARATVKKALTRPGALDDATIQLLAAKIHLSFGEIDQAFIALGRAERSSDERAIRRSEQFAEAIRQDYGEVRFFPKGRGHRRARLYVGLETPLIGLSKKKAFEQSAKLLAKGPRSFPTTLYLPWGSYSANGVKFEHQLGQRTQVAVPFPRIAVVRRTKNRKDRAASDVAVQSLGGHTEIFDVEEADEQALDKVINDLVRKKPDLIISLGDHTTKKLIAGVEDVPVVYGHAGDSAALRGLRKGRRVTGVRGRLKARAVLKRLRKIGPKIGRVGVLYDPRVSADYLQRISQAAEGLELEITGAELTSAQGASSALEELSDVDAYWLIDDPSVANDSVFTMVAKSGYKLQRPVIAPNLHFVRQGALMSVSPDAVSVGKVLAQLSRNLLWSGGKRTPPLAWPQKAHWSINRRAARILGFRIPYSVIRASHRMLNTAPPKEILSP